MRLPEFSEFSFGYALTDNLIHGKFLPGLRGAPVFPSPYAEGKAGGGYDVKIPTSAAPLFLQFKIPQVVTRKSKLTPAGFPIPYYRMHIRPGGHSLQHQNLLLHERRQRLVFYVTPTFHTTADLNNSFTKQQVPANSVFIRPSQIGRLDDQQHHIAYVDGNPTGWLYSEPRQLEGAIDSDNFFEQLQVSLRETRPTGSTTQLLDFLSEEIIETYEESSREAERRARERPLRHCDPFSPTWRPGYQEPIEEIAQRARREATQHFHAVRDRLGAAWAAGYMARFYLDCELLILGLD